MANQNTKDPKGPAPRSNTTHSPDAHHVQQYGEGVAGSMDYANNGYGSQVMHAMYGYGQNTPIQTKAIPSQKAATLPQQKQIGQVQLKEEETESIQEFPLGGTLQKKLSIGSPDDHYEKEADAVADQVMRMPEPVVQRKCAHCEAEEKLLQRKKLDTLSTLHEPVMVQRKCAACQTEEGLLQRKSLASTITPFIQAKGSEGGVANEEVSQQIQSSKGSGSPLADKTRSSMEQSFGANFSGVRVHTGNQAIQLSQQLNAQAFTTGSDIYFNQGKYSPETSQGKHLLAHELTHIIQQSSSIQRDIDKTKEDTEVIKLQKNINTGEWKDAYKYLNAQWMKVLLEKINALTEPEIDALITNADAAKTAKGSIIGEGGKNRVLAALLSVKSTKKSGLSDSDIDKAKEKALTIPFDQRKEIITFLDGSRSKAAKKLHNVLNKPFLGYTASAYDFEDRFLKHAGKLGFDIEPTTSKLPTTPWPAGKDDPDRQSTHTTDTATNSFDQSDIVFFSGHQYAQYKRPGLYTNDASTSCFNISAISKKLNRVKVVASTSCATICKDVAEIYANKFPNALVLGYKYSAPANGEAVSSAFTRNLVKKGAIDLTTTAGLEAVKDSWKRATISNPGKKGQPGILYGGNVEFYDGQKWQTVKAGSKENDCRYH